MSLALHGLIHYIRLRDTVTVTSIHSEYCMIREQGRLDRPSGECHTNCIWTENNGGLQTAPTTDILVEYEEEEGKHFAQ